MTTIAAVSAPPAGVISQASSSLGGMDGDAFLKLLVAQLRYQNPLAPSDPTDLMLQTAQLTQLENVQQMVALQRRDLVLQEAVIAAGLVGHEVTASPSGSFDDLITGVVDRVRFTDLGPVLDIGGVEVGLGDLSEIRRNGAPASDPGPL